MLPIDEDPGRYLRQVKVICETHRDDSDAEKEERLRIHLDQLLTDGWSRYDCDRVEERARLLLRLPQQRRDENG